MDITSKKMLVYNSKDEMENAEIPVEIFAAQ